MSFCASTNGPYSRQGQGEQSEADEHAEAEYEQFAARRRALLEAEAERAQQKPWKMRPSIFLNHRNQSGTTQAMKLHFEPNLDYQRAAIEAVCDLFRRQEICRTEFTNGKWNGKWCQREMGRIHRHHCGGESGGWLPCRLRTAGSGGNDVAYLYDSAGNDTFFATPTYSY